MGLILRKREKTRRTLYKNVNKNRKLLFFGTNCNGISSKKDSLLANVTKFCPAAFFLQETKLQRKGHIKIRDYEIFEIIRQNKEGGSLLTGVHKKFETSAY